MEKGITAAALRDGVRLAKGGDAVEIIDQTLLPGELRRVELREAPEMFEAIASLRVRGAPAIGIFAGYCVYVLSLGLSAKDADAAMAELQALAGYLDSSRPTAVNLGWALRRMLRAAGACRGLSLSALRERLREEAEAIHREDMEMCLAIAENGLALLRDGDGILTHCNAGPLATSRYGTALGPILLGAERGMDFHVYADETRPLLQGARLTALELMAAGVDVTLICDNMASAAMKSGKIQAVLVGCDRVAANGDAANKIGTSGVAVLARHYGVPFYVLGPRSTVDMSCATGADIGIELRDPEEIRSKFYVSPMAPEGVKCWNPAFDVTDAGLITAIVTDRGVCRPPYTDSLAALFRERE